ncbi:MAG: GreA/GreB family elongation factor [Polyangiaceae bacterium]
MSKAFTKDDAGDAELLVVPRAPLAEGVPNYVTPRGLQLLRAEQAKLERERSALLAQGSSDGSARLNALAQRAADLHTRLASAELVDPHSQPRSEARFGSDIRVRHESGKESTYRIVGVDEADAASGLLAFSSPLARALLGKRVGDVAELRTPLGSEELELLEIRYTDDTAAQK